MIMKMFFSPASPYVRKAMVVAHEKGLADKIEKISITVNPTQLPGELAGKNPIGKIPCLVLDDGAVIFDSPVVAAYLDSLSGAPLTPASGPARFQAMTLEALADGILDAGLLVRFEAGYRPPEKQSDVWVAGQREKMNSGLDALEKGYIKQLDGPLTIGVIAVGCALGWIDFREVLPDWRKTRPKLAAWYAEFAKRPSMMATTPKAA
jgi:glutathione S-transferase